MEKTRRNDECGCGSGKKHKNCHGNAQAEATKHNAANPKQLTQVGLLKCLMAIVKANEEITISLASINALEKNEALAHCYNAKDDSFTLKVIRVKQQVIAQPRKKLILPPNMVKEN